MATLPTLRPASGSGIAVSGPTLNLYSWASGSIWSNNGAEPFAPTDYPDRLLQPVTSSPASGDSGLGTAPGGNATTITRMGFDDMPANFLAMSTLSIRYSSAQFGTYGDDSALIGVSIHTAGGALLAGYTLGITGTKLGVEVFGGGTWQLGGAPAYNKTNSFSGAATLDTTATKAAWDGAYLEFEFSDTRSMGSDSAAAVLVDFQLEGTYTAIPLPYTGIQVTRPAVMRSANW